MSDCIFCKIAKGEIPSTTVFEDEQVLAFEDIAPQAPVHVLVIPKAHVATLNDLTDDQEGLVGHCLMVARDIARRKGLADRGYRVVGNCQESAGQSVWHIHFHLLGGRDFNWPPG